MFISRSLKVFAIILAVIALMAATFAYANTNTFPTGVPRAGEGSAPISGYAVSNVVYTIDWNALTITAVAFDLDAAASIVRVRLVTGGTLFNTCSAVGMHWTCTTAGVTIQAADILQVVAIQ